MSRSRSRSMLLAGACSALVLMGAACSKSDDSVKAAAGGSTPAKGCAALDASGVPAGAPSPEMPTEIKPVLVKTDLKVGDGAEVTTTDTVTVQYIGVGCTTGKVFDSSWSSGKPVTFPLNKVIAGWTQGIPGMKAGGSRQLVIPSALGYGSNPPDGSGIKPNETLIFIVDLVSTGPAVSTPTTEAVALPSAKGKPCVAATNIPPVEGKPEVSVPVGPPPTELKIEDLKVGSGTAVSAADTVTVNYVGVACSTGMQFASSWDSGSPASLALADAIPGWSTGLVGMQVGGQRLLVLPPDQAFGTEARPGVAPDETVVFVMELVKIGA